MPKGQPNEKAVELLRQPCPAVMGTLNAAGEPVTVATWYLLRDDGTILLNLNSERARLKHLSVGAPASLTALAPDSWYTHVSVQGTVIERYDDPDLTDIDALSRHYGGEPYADRDGKRVTVILGIERWHGWGAAKPTS